MAAKSEVEVSDTNAISVLQYLVKTSLETLSVIRYVCYDVVADTRKRYMWCARNRVLSLDY